MRMDDGSRQGRRMLQRAILLACCLASICLAGGCDRTDLTDGPPKKVPPPETPPGPEPPKPRDVLVNEVVVVNGSSLEDESGAFPPWVELYNPMGASIDLSGVAVSNQFLDPLKWKIPPGPEAVIEAGGFLVIYADGDPDGVGGLHANFLLTRTNLQIVFNAGSDVVTLNAKNIEVDQAVGLSPDGQGDFVPLVSPTPGQPNSEPKEPEEPGEPEEGSFLRGDVDLDGKVGFGDTVLLLKITRGEEPIPACQDRADANDDGAVDNADYVFLGNALFDAGVTIPPPFPDAGVDPTPDALVCPAGG